MLIDANNYLILVRTGRHPEMHEIARDEVVGLSAARRIARCLRLKYPQATIDVFLCEGFPRRTFFVNA